jgi:RNA polymerase sigma-70 factor (ECF subfamily)
MDFDDEDDGRRALSSADPVPPGDWEGFGRTARLEAIFSAHQPQLVRYFRGRASTQDIGDLVQECFSRFVANRGHAPGTVERPGAFLIRLARNLLINNGIADKRHHRREHHAFEEEMVVGPDPHAALEARDTIRRIEEEIAKLKPKTREIFLMHRFDGVGYEEIARLKGMSVGGVEKQIAKAMIAVRKARARRP